MACYADNAITIQRIIQEQLRNYQGLTNLNLNIILEACGNDRNKVYNEIGKITSFFENKKIETESLSRLVNSPRIDDFNNLKDEVIKGNKLETNKLLNSTVIDQDRGVYYLTLINQRFNKLMDILRVKKGNNFEVALNSLKPPVFWKDKQNIIDQAKVWNTKKIQIVLKELFDLEIILKSNGNINKDTLIRKFLIDICCLANS